MQSQMARVGPVLTARLLTIVSYTSHYFIQMKRNSSRLYTDLTWRLIWYTRYTFEHEPNNHTIIK